MAAKSKVLLTGDPPLVEEYSTVMRDRGYDVSVRLGRGTGTVRLPKGVAKVKAVPRGTALGLELTNCDVDVKRENIALLERGLSRSALILSSSVAVSVSEQSSWMSSPDRLVGIGALPSLLSGGLIEFAGSHHTAPASIKAALALAERIGKETAVVRDSVGMVLPRILCMLANEACFAVSEKVASSEGVDTAMKLGTNYPRGPIEWAELLRADQVFAVLTALHRNFGEDRYRPSPALAEAARLGTFEGVLA